MNQEKVPVSVKKGKLKLGDFTLITHILEDGTRIIEQESLLKFMEYLENGGRLTKKDATKASRFAYGLEYES